ncbi:hypothetical protein VTK73DRAFT_3019 [Phialemonium thermophilum]|uniref:Uncharacterized protein n=1 Tax=Phialemonium thermophilum TaxID=223376 RepID=A0ABR3VLU6_9PEZI
MIEPDAQEQIQSRAVGCVCPDVIVETGTGSCRMRPRVETEGARSVGSEARWRRPMDRERDGWDRERKSMEKGTQGKEEKIRLRGGP